MDAAVYAKIKAMQGKRLTESDYRELLRCRSVSEIAGYLKHKTGYADVLSDINENTIHRGQLEQLLRRFLLDEYDRIVNFIDAGADVFYSYFLIKNEVEQLISFLRYLHSGMASQYALILPSYLAGKLSINLFEVAKCESFKQLAELLKTSRYGHVLQKLNQTFEDGRFSIIQVETTLITFFYHEVLRMIDMSVNGKEKDEMREFFLQRAELYNIVAAVRAKEKFKLSPEKIKPLLLPF